MGMGASMKNEIVSAEEILNEHISGFHRYILTEPVHLCYASRNLCQMLGVSTEELLSENQDLYAQRVHPADRAVFEDYLRQLKTGEQTMSVTYRLVRADSKTLYVKDTTCVRRQETGILTGDSVLTDITEIKRENRNLQFLNETIPCGFVRYTCEKIPKITYFNDRMLQFLRYPRTDQGSPEELEMYRQNLYLWIPIEERRRFAGYLERVKQTGGPIAGEMTVLRWDGTKAYLFGWVTKCVNEDGVEEFQSACMDLTERFREKREKEATRYLKALAEVYDKIFEFDRSAHTVKCLHGGNSPMFRWAEQIAMPMEEATEKWVAENVAAEDQERLHSFFDSFIRNAPESEAPPVIRYRAMSSGGMQKRYTGLFVKVDSSVSLFCCRSVQESEETDSLRSENISLKGINENMQKIVMHFTDGLAAFEVIDDVVRPLYASDNVCEFFGYTRDMWLSIMDKQTPIEEFIAHSKLDYNEAMALLRKGEAEFTYDDLEAGKKRRIKAVCSRKTSGASGPLYVMLYHIDEKIQPPQEMPHVRIRTFGFFDVFVDEKPIAFRNEKSKELFALLVDRKGGFVSSEEAISYLWEDEPANSVTLARYRKVALRLKNLLEEYGISEIVESVNGKRRLVTEKVSCDLLDYLSGEAEYAQLFKGSYLSNYSWAETTLAELMGENLF